ncbi:uncharacterized protein LOC128155556 [Crassostrea angulata]|uniref:uncharacterized protein LOC128155556 n=1 Tax=Magallana angulata TaxID=2784310 RepID=UPI0022B19150|nr:uncharacterized protein LOC128155556 [Crassostrea angulata]
MKLFAICVAVVWLTWFSAESHLPLHQILSRRSQDLATEHAMMMEFGDSDHNGRLSGEEIQNFFMYFINFDFDTAYSAANRFLKDGDIDGDGSLDERELVPTLQKYNNGQ